MPLINTQIKEALPRDKDYKLSDGSGMYLLIKKNGYKYWRIDYRFRGKRKTLSLGESLSSPLSRFAIDVLGNAEAIKSLLLLPSYILQLRPT